MSNRTLLWLLIAILVIVIVVKMCKNNNENFNTISSCAAENNFSSTIKPITNYYDNLNTLLNGPETCVNNFLNSSETPSSALTTLQKCIKNANNNCSNDTLCYAIMNANDSKLTQLNNNFNNAFNNTQFCLGLGINNCENCSLSNNTLTCQCLNNNNNLYNTTLSEYNQCMSETGNISNCSGELTCGSCNN